MVSRKILALAMLASGVMAASAATAGDSLRGVYRGVIHTDCLESQNGFTDPPTVTFIEGGYTGRYADTSVSTMVFPGDGTMTETFHGTTVFGSTPSIGTWADGTFTGTCRYSVTTSPNRSFRMQGNCSGYLPTGPGAGSNTTVEGVDSQGQVSEDGIMIVIGSGEPDVNTLSLTTFGYVAARRCTSSGTLVRVRF